MLKRAGAATKSLLHAPHCHVFAKAVEFGVVGARGRQVAGLSKEAPQRWAHYGRQHSERLRRGRSWPRGVVRLEEALLAR